MTRLRADLAVDYPSNLIRVIPAQGEVLRVLLNLEGSSRDASETDAGVEVTSTNEGCDCSLLVRRPCRHGDAFCCACGHDLVPAEDMPSKPGLIPADRS